MARLVLIVLLFMHISHSKESSPKTKQHDVFDILQKKADVKVSLVMPVPYAKTRHLNKISKVEPVIKAGGKQGIYFRGSTVCQRVSKLKWVQIGGKWR